MAFVFVDRESTYPNKYKVTRDDGSTYYVLLERADEPVVEGTPLNAETFQAMMADAVKSVNGMAPDKDGNVTIESADEVGY